MTSWRVGSKLTTNKLRANAYEVFDISNEEVVLERLIRLTKSGKILWWRTGKGYKTKISKIRITLKLEDELNYSRCIDIYIVAPGKIGSSIDYFSYDYVADELYSAIEDKFSGTSIDVLEEKLREMESREQTNS